MRTWATLFPDGSYPVGCECDLLWLSSTPNDLSNWHTSSSLLAVDRDQVSRRLVGLPGLVVPDAITVLADRCSYSPTGPIVDDLRARACRLVVYSLIRSISSIFTLRIREFLWKAVTGE